MRAARAASLRVVLDTNILVRGLMNEHSPSARILRAAEQREIIVLLSTPLRREYHEILTDPELTEKYPRLEERRVKAVLERLTYFAQIVRSLVRFRFPRDPKDAKLLELAISGHATHLITTDRDLLDLAKGHDQAASRLRRRSPRLGIIKPNEFIALTELH